MKSTIQGTREGSGGSRAVSAARYDNRSWSTFAAIFAALLASGLLAAQPARAADAVDDSYSVPSDGFLDVAAPGLLENDCCPSRDLLSASLETPPAHGEVTVSSDGSFTYQHDGSASTSDSFQYRATDVNGFDVATVSLTLLSPAGPEATGDSYTVTVGGTLTVDPPGVLQNDFDAEGDPLTAVLVQAPALASDFTLDPDGGFTYVHSGEAGDADSFLYSASDGTSTSEPATVSIAIDSEPDGGGTTIILTVGFDRVSQAGITSQMGITTEFGGGKAKLEELRLLATDVPAVGSGPGMPPQTIELRLVAHDEKLAAYARAQFESCHKMALIAQARPDLYHLEVVMQVPEGAIIEGTAELVRIAVEGGTVSCALGRTP